MEQATKFAETTQILMNVSEFTDVSQATDTLISAVQAFEYTAETSMDVVDLLNTIGNNYAISTADLAQSLTKSSASLVAAGGDLAEAAALTATANAIVQDADAVGTALKTTSLRLRGTSVKELEEDGLDTDGAIESKSKLRSKVKSLSGVDILTDEGAYKSTYEILSQIADVWEDISNMDQAALLELLAGKRNASVLAAILQAPEELKAAYEDAKNAEGSALKENEEYLDSIQGKIDQFTNSMQTMWSNALNSEFVKFIVDFGKMLINVIDKLGLFNSLLITVATIYMVKNKVGPIVFLGQISDLIRNAVSKIPLLIGSLKATATATDVATVSSLKNAMATAGLQAKEREAILTKMGLANATNAQTLSQNQLSYSTLMAMVNEGKLSQAQANTIMSLLGITQATNEVNAARLNEMLIAQGLDATQRGQIITALGLKGATQALTREQVLQALATTTLSASQKEAILAALGLAAANKGLAASLSALWTAIWPILALAGAALVIWGIVKAVDSVVTTTAELEEELGHLNDEISEIESDLESLNSELETAKERMAELLAMPSLSFVEQEELANLKQTTAELERQVALKEALAESKKDVKISTLEQYVDRAWHSKSSDKKYATSSSGKYGTVIAEDQWNMTGVNTKSALDDSISGYVKLKEELDKFDELIANWDPDKEVQSMPFSEFSTYETFRDIDAAKNTRDDIKKYMDQAANGINMVLADEEFDDIKYGMSDQLDAFLDEVNAYRYKWEEAKGIASKSDAIASIFDDTASDDILQLKEDLTAIASDESLDDAQKQAQGFQLVSDAINSTTGDYDRLKTSMDIIGISADEVARSFVQLSKMPDSSTVEGITAQYQKGVDALSKYTGEATDIIAEFTDLDGNVEQITWSSMFDDKGETVDTQISKVLKGADETTRAEFARIVKSVNDGTMSIEQAMTSFAGAGLVSVSKLIEESFGELNKSVFKGLEDEISGFIDTFSEFSAALEDVASSMDLLHTAQEQYNNSGQVSVKTALELMQSTDQWNKILTVENGKITLNAEAQDILVQSKLETVKANLAEAKASIQNQLAQLGAADATLLSAEASDITTEAYTIYTNAMNSYSASIAGFGAALDALVNGRIFGDDGIIGSFQSAYNATKEVKTYENNTNIDSLRAKLAEVNQMEDFFEGVDTFDEFKKNYDFDETPGDKYGEDDKSKAEEALDAFQREMEYWKNRISANQARYEQLQNEIDLLEAKGQKADASYYEEQIKLENERLSLLEQQKAAALAYRNTFAEGSEQWWEWANTLNDIESELDDVTSSILDLQDAIAEIDAYKFEEFNTRLDNLVSKLETIRDLIAPDGEEDWFDDEGNWTEAGVAVLGSQVQQLEMYKQGLEETRAELDKYNKAYSDNTKAYYESLGIHSEQEYYDKVEELTEQQYDFAESISDTEQSIVDMYESNIDAVEEYIETLIDGYNDYIDGVKEALDAERDLYEFKKNVQKQAKDIAELERRIASLSGSTNKSEIAERRKLEAQLYEAREGLNDTYYDHAKDAQNTALDEEQSAYEETMTKMVEGMRTSLETATQNMDEFLMGVTSMVTMNADAVLAKYQETELPLDDALTNPWEAAKAAVGNYSGDALDLMNQWTKNGFLTTFPEAVKGSLSSPWTAGSSAANAFKTSVDTVMDNVVAKIETNVKSAGTKLSNLYQQILDTEKRAAEANVVVGGNNNGNNVNGNNSGNNDPKPDPEPEVKLRGLMQTSKEMILGPKSFVDANTETINGVKYYRDSKTGYYYKISELNSKRKYDGGRTTGWAIPRGTWFYTKYAKGTAGTTRDEWAITDEPQFGDELTMYATPEGTLSFMRAGSTVVPADITKNLVEWGKLNPDMLNANGIPNINMISNAVNKPELNITFDALVKAENITEETLPAVKKLVTQELNRFTRELNYALKGKGAR